MGRKSRHRFTTYEVEEYHTYLVGGGFWGFSVWAHNTGDCGVPASSTAEALQSKQFARRFDTNKKIKDTRKNGIPYDPAKGNGIPTTSTDLEPIGPDTIRAMTGARAADSYIDIDITGKNVLRRRTKAGAPEIVIQEDILPDDIVGYGKVKKSRLSDED